MLRVFERAFQRGCGISLQEVLTSARYTELRAAQDSLFVRFPENTDEGRALRAGHMTMGRLLNTFSETEALEQATDVENTIGRAVEYRALIQCLGEHLVAAATHCLSPDVIDLATQWREGTAEDQIAIACQLNELFRSTDQGQIGDNISMAVIHDKVYRKAIQDHGDECVLPRVYGSWDKDSCPANCQGKTQMLVAFARLAGSRVLAADPIVNARHLMTRMRGEAVAMIEDDLLSRGLIEAAGVFAESLQLGRLDCQIDGEDFFHTSAALELKDGRWVLIDPHCIVWGVFPSTWGMSEIAAKLEKYGEVLPGVQLMQHDHGTAEAYFKGQVALAQDLLARSRSAEERSRSAKTVLDLAELIAEGDDLEVLLPLDAAERGQEVIDVSNPEMRQYVSMVFAAGGEANLLDPWRALFDPDFMPTRIGEWVTFYHATAVNLFLNQPFMRGELLHPACEFARAEHHVAMSALNTVRQDMGMYGAEDSRFFLDYGFDQTSLYNAMASRYGELSQAAREAVLALPLRHSLNDWRLRTGR